ncbi:myelin basic protein isoform X2 [Hyla sarda]|uniref:myelin basic protein isoform X2 n=1 Tax=Hyla sarda TaxID=327740 RepID=UPI0024C2B72B|nr:myelin basic protein isoform X2 [Hyla sarda]
MGNHVGRRDHTGEDAAKNTENRVVEEEKPVSEVADPAPECDDNEVFGCFQDRGWVPSLQKTQDVNQNNGTSSKGTAVTDSTSTEDPKNDWKGASPADAASRPHLVRLFSRDAPGREDNTFKDRPSESDELQTIQEDSGSTSPETDLMASQKLSRAHGSKQMASASTSDRSRHGYGAHGRYRDSGLLDSLGRFFGGDKHVPRKGKDVHLSRSRSYHSSSPQRSYQRSHYAHGRHVDDNPVVHFFRNIVTPRTPPPSQPKRGLLPARFSWGGEGHKACYGGSSPRFFDHHKSYHKGYKDVHREGQGTLSRIFKLGGRDSRSSSPMARR